MSLPFGGSSLPLGRVPGSGAAAAAAQATADQALTTANQALAGGLSTAYEIDFTVQPTQDLIALGPHTIDGHTWYVPKNNALSVLGITNGTGLVLATSDYAITQGTQMTSGALFARLADLGIDPNWGECWLQFKAVFGTPPSGASQAEAKLGMIASEYIHVDDWTTYRANNINRFSVAAGIQASGAGGVLYGGLEVNFSETPANSQAYYTKALATPGDIFAIHVKGNLVEEYIGTSAAGAWPAKSALTMIYRSPRFGLGALPFVDGPAAWLTVGRSGTANFTLVAKKMKVETAR
jgi:hypothetical protein